jgi:hypothetical protein
MYKQLNKQNNNVNIYKFAKITPSGMIKSSIEERSLKTKKK